jgi:hypothetical protein
MTRSGSPDDCRHGPAGRSYPPEPEPEFVTGTDPARDAAFGALTTALEAIPDPVAAAVGQLTADDVRAALAALPLPGRICVLLPVGLRLTPHRVGLTLARDVLKRMSRVGGHDRRHAAGVLGSVTNADMMIAAMAPEELAEIASEKLTAWPDALLQTALWANCQCSASGARVWVWASAQPWFAPTGASDELLAGVVVAAQAVIDATAEFELFPAGAGNEHVTTSDVSFSATDEDFLDGADVPQTTGEEAGAEDVSAEAMSGSVETGLPEMNAPAGADPVDTAASASIDGLGDQMTALEAVLALGAHAASTLAETLAAGRRPDDGSLTALSQVCADFDRVANAVRVSGVDFTEDSTSSMRAAIDAAWQTSGDQKVRHGLAKVTALQAPIGQVALTAQLKGATERAHELLGVLLWSAAERQEADGLTALADLAEGELSQLDVFALLGKISAVRPDLAVLAINATSLSLAAAGEPAAQIPTAPEPAPAPDEQDAHAAVQEIVPILTDANFVRTATSPKVPRFPAQPRKGTEPTMDPSRAPDLALPVTTPAEPVTPPAEPVPEVAAAVAQLVATGRHAFAAAAALPEIGVEPSVLTVSALAAAVRGPSGPMAGDLRAGISALDAAQLLGTTPLLLVTTALLRTALITGDPTAGAVLVELGAHLEPHLGAIADEVGRRALQGVLLDAPPLATVADVADVERALVAARKDAADLLRPRKLRFKRASDIAAAWFAPDGIIGAALHVVTNDDRAGGSVVAAALKLLTDPAGVSRELDVLDQSLRSGSSKPLQGSGRGDLLSAAAEAVSPLARWTEAAAAMDRHNHGAQWSTSEVEGMRTAVLAHAEAAAQALDATAASADLIVGAAAEAAASSLRHSVALLDGKARLSTLELDPADVLGLDVLHVAGARVDPVTGVVTLPEDVEDSELIASTTRSWDDAVRLHVEKENFAAAHRLVRAGQAQLLTGSDGSEQQLSLAVVDLVSSVESSAIVDLDRLRSDLGAELRTARANNQITEEQDAELTSLLEDSGRPNPNLAAVRATLDRIARTLPDYTLRATERLRARLAKAQADHSVSAKDAARISASIDTGDLATADEFIYLLETNEELPTARTYDELDLFFPAVPNTLPVGITTELVEVARSSGVHPGCAALDFSSLSSDQADSAAEALANWATLGATPAQSRSNVSELTLLLPALRMIGIEAMKVDHLPDLRRHRDGRFIDLREVTIIGKAMVPAFGSNLGDRRRIMLAWGQPSAETLMSWVDQDPSSGSVLVAYFGTMSAQVRTNLAVRSLQSAAAVVVLDDAALAYLAARGARQMDATMRVLLPFASVNPYVRQKRGLVAEEMFYGRDPERRQVLDKDGTQIIYGGRGLGKSALLRSAESEFERQGQVGEHCAVYLSLDDIGGDGARGADAVWDTLLQHLIDRAVVPAKKPRGTAGSAHARVVAGVNAWLKENSSRRLLILLDETDRFFESDAPKFLATSNLRNLGVSTNSRAKVVFAGLHSVQRFTKVAENGPFSHLAQRPTVIGPLKPQFALNLLTAPMAAMGYTFEEPDLVNRVLAYCSYQPFLLQMFGHRLVERMHKERRAAGPTAAIPYVVTRADITSVQTHADLREDISNAFRETLHLDPRYNVIANVMAKRAHEFGLDARLTDSELREECLGWWEDGFASLDVEAFRAYLSEMVGLGVLARNPDGRGWRLRGPSVLTMVGLPSEVDTQLLGADTESQREDVVAFETRTLLEDGQRSALTAGQLDDILGEHANQVRVILGSAATGIDIAFAGVNEAADIGARFTVPRISSRGVFEAELITGEPGTRRVVASDLRSLSDDVCVKSLDASLDRTPDRAGVTRSVALVSTAQQMGFWRQVFAREGDTPELGTVALRRYDERTLKIWAIVAEKFHGSRTTRLLEVTGGWPVLVERAAEQASTTADEVATLDQIEAHLATAAGAAELVDLVGICADEEVTRAFQDLVEYLGDEQTDLADLHLVVKDATSNPEGVIACLRALGVLTPDRSGMFRIEPVLAKAWSLRT